MPPEPAPTGLPAAALAEHVSFLRALARGLVRDEHAADELVQETLAAGLRGGPVGSPRAWLAGVLRRRAADARRTQARREHHEEAAARPERDERDAPTMAARLETQQRLAAAVNALAEPYREVVFLRFYEELPPRRIAARLDLPVETVKTRLKRALDQLRARLDAEHGGSRAAWCAALMPLLEVRRPLAVSAAAKTLVAGGLVKLELGVVAGALLAALGWWAWPGGAERVAPGGALAPEPALAEASPASVPESSREDAAEPQTPARAEIAAPELAAAPARGWRFEGRVVDADGRGVAGAAVTLGFAFELGTVPVTTLDATSGDDGRYAGPWSLPEELSTRSVVFLSADAQDSQGRAGSFGVIAVDPAREPLGGVVRLPDVALPAEPAWELSGRVVDRDGAPLVGVPVRLFAGERPLKTKGVTREGGELRLSLAFAVERELAADETRLAVEVGSEALGVTRSAPFDPRAERRVDVGELVLDAPGALELELRFPDGRPVTDEPVELVAGGAAVRRARTDEGGRLRATALPAGELLVRLPELRVAGAALELGPVATGGSALLTVPAQRLRVRVVDQEGGLVPGATLVAKHAGGASREFQPFGEGGVGSFAAAPGRWRLVARQPGAEFGSAPAISARIEIELAADDYDREVELALDFDPPRGALRLVARDDAGRSVAGPFQLELFAPGFDEEAALELATDAEGRAAGLPAGRYRARVWPPGGLKAAHFDATGELLVRADAETEATVTLPRAGWLELALPPALDASSPPPRVTFAPADGGPTRELFFLRPTDAGDPRLGPARPGETTRSERLLPGAYTLAVTLPDREPLERTLRILPGETTRVTLD